MLNRRNNNSLSTYNPFHEMENFERNFFRNPFDFFENNTLAEFKTDITDEGNYYKLEADLPGFKKEDIHLDINGGFLTLSAQRHSEHEDKDANGKYLRCERSYGSYTRTFDLADVNVDEIKAKYNDGVLTLTMPKKTESLPNSKHLEIE